MRKNLSKAISLYRSTVGNHATKLAAVTAACGLAMSNALAALPAAATTAINDAGTDLLSAVGLVITSMVAVWGLRKLGQKMGWM